jgi:hypothetical protein
MSFSRKGFRKFGEQKVSYDGYSFASKGEAALYQVLKLYLHAKEIDHIQVQDHVKLSDAGILYIPDFRVKLSANQMHEWHEFKGFKTDVWGIKRRLWKVYGPGPLHIWEGNYRNIRCTETIIPKGIEKDGKDRD